jgi:hypothetical protein
MNLDSKTNTSTKIRLHFRIIEAREFEAKNRKSGVESSPEEEQKAKEWAKSLVN